MLDRTALNFLHGTLNPPLAENDGIGQTGAQEPPPNATWGSLDLGGASAQLTFFQPAQDIMANMFKLQLGRTAHWNLYTHSFLRFGRDIAFTRWACAVLGRWDPPGYALVCRPQSPTPRLLALVALGFGL